MLEVAVSEDKPTVEKPSSLMLRAIAKVMMDRNAEALQDLADPRMKIEIEVTALKQA